MRAFANVKTIGLALEDVEASFNWIGFPVLRARGCFMAAIAAHASAEPASLVVRYDVEERERLLEDAPDTYYVTDFYRRYPLVLARLSHLNRDALRDLLSVSHRMALAKAGPRRKVSRPAATNLFTTRPGPKPTSPHRGRRRRPRGTSRSA
jgi:hypothetical protein